MAKSGNGLSNKTHQYEMFPDRLYLRRINAASNMKRYYFMAVQRDLFGGASLIRQWGRIGTMGQVRIDHHHNEKQAIEALARIKTTKCKRGYE